MGQKGRRPVLLELEIENFKNIERQEIAFGHFTSMRGPAGAGKSAVLDAVSFLGDLARGDIDAACLHQARARLGPLAADLGHDDYSGVACHPASLFTDCDPDREMGFKAVMLIDPETPRDKPSAAAAIYELRLCYEPERHRAVVSHESLTIPARSEVEEALIDPETGKLSVFMQSIVKGTRRSPSALVDTADGEIFYLDSGGGRSVVADPAKSRLTVVGHHKRHPMVAAAGAEMSSWRRFTPSFGAMTRRSMRRGADTLGGLGEFAEGATEAFRRLELSDPEAVEKVIAVVNASDHRVQGLSAAESASDGYLLLMADVGGEADIPASAALSSTTGRLLPWLLMSHDRGWGGTLCVDDHQTPCMADEDAARIHDAMAACLADSDQSVSPQNRPRQIICLETTASPTSRQTELASADALVWPL